MRNQRLIIVIILSLFLSTSIAQDKFKSYKDVKKIPNGMNIIHENNRTKALVGIHGFYPVYWVQIHNEWVQPFNFLIKEDMKTFFYKYDWNDCPSKVAQEFSVELQNLIEEYPDVDDWQIVGHSMGGSVVMFTNQSFLYNEKITFNTVATPVYYEREKVPFFVRAYESIFNKRCSENINSLDSEFENGFTNKHVQWRNIKEFDSQFKKYDFDPYDNTIKDSIVFQFPDSLDGERVGHTSSLYFSVLEIIN
ncbi:MAG: hypothetical protein CMG20_02755 [Candidatus Marinimicrobia bacterium]|nr:hypothetical protein [Candidatus Neomarinimicrobiota bacterium]|tara:strand:+ start:11768 stop:12517 length:750 start_codon:yes stop_codon:yes gene_type:complete